MDNIKKIIRNAIDIHVHIGPEIIPRKYNVQGLITSEKGKIGGIVLKNHFYPTTPFIKEAANKQLLLFGSITLNNAVGGLNPDAISAASYMNNNPFFVWFPTINAKNFLNKSEYEIAPEWVNDRSFTARNANQIEPVLLNNNKILAVLQTIKKCNAVLATGHISWEESVSLVSIATKIGIQKIVVTHPIYQRIDMPVTEQKILAKKGCFIEHCYSMYSIDKIPIEKIAMQIKAVGPKYIIASSDVGQTYSKSPSESLYEFAQLLIKEGISENDIFTMMVTNPKTLLDIK